MPRIFDNIDLRLHPALTDTLKISHRADFCVGYFNLRGWKLVDEFVELWPGGEGDCCRLIVGMSTLPQEELREAFSLVSAPDGLDAQTALRLKKRAAEEFRSQLVLGAPNNADEAGLRRLSAQLKSKKLVVKLFLRYRLHAKLYLIHRVDPNNPATGFLGSSNLTFPGLSKQGELNVDVLDQDACQKLQKWFEDRWDDKWCIDITSELIEILDTSWAREELLPPYHIYLKMAYHLSQEARAGLSEFHVPRDFGNKLLAFQTAAVKIAAQYLNKRGGVVIGDVVGLGKTLMSVALARIFQDDHGTETLIICPKNLMPMWEDYVHQYRMAAKIVPLSTAMRDLPTLSRYRVVLIDESHNLRNREGKRYKVIQEYIEKNTSKCILLSATPYNKSYLDLSSQLQLFVAGDQDLGIRPEHLLKEIGETEFIRRHQAPVRSLAAFEKSTHPDDWRDLMRLYLVRRTRGFIKDNYAKPDEKTGRKYLTFDTGERFYFPDRIPKTVKFEFNEKDPNDPYARLYSNEVVNAINGLTLPRYGLGNYIAPAPHHPPTEAEGKELAKLSRAGKRLMGFCRTNLFKRLESGGPAFIQSLERHVLRNFVYLHAIENGLPLPIGTQGAELLDAKVGDRDLDDLLTEIDDEQDNNKDKSGNAGAFLRDEKDFRKRATEIYERYSTELKKRFKWLSPTLFIDAVRQDLVNDTHALIKVINKCGVWDAAKDAKLNALEKLLAKKYSGQKVLVFTQFADTANYLAEQLKRRGLSRLEGVTGDDENPTAIAWCFSPESNKKRDVVKPEHELRILIATDVLSEGQNLQDCHVIVNYDLPWAIIRLIQRAGRVDRIGQKSDTIYCNSFLPADGVERIINLRGRVRARLKENAEVVGSDESFFEDDANDQPIIDLYNENSGILEETDSVRANDAQALMRWRESHKPFHWFVEFYGIMQRGGFDAVIGNPPYVERRVIQDEYDIRHFVTEPTNNLFAYMSERAVALLGKDSYFGFIIPVSSISTDKFAPLQTIFRSQKTLWASHYDDRPSRLFEGLEHARLSIILYQRAAASGGEKNVFSSKYQKWYAEERDTLFSTLAYARVQRFPWPASIPKLGFQIEAELLDKLFAQPRTLEFYERASGQHVIYYTRKISAFLNMLDFIPEIRDGRGRLREPSELKTVAFATSAEASAALCLLNSTLCRWFIVCFGDCRNLNRRDVVGVPIDLDKLVAAKGKRLTELARTLSKALAKTSELRTMRFGNEILKVQCIIPRHAKDIIDEIDEELADFLGLTPIARDFVINYAYKYRMGADAQEDQPTTAAPN